MKKILLCIAFLVLLFCFFKNNIKEEILIPSDSIRLRVISNSNDELDIKKKMQLKDYLEDILFDLIRDANNKDEVRDILIDKLDYISNKVYEFLNSYDYKIDYGQNFFPRKVYRGVIYEEGMYDSLVITLGNGNGNNWWCVLFPPLCLIEDNNTTADVEYRLFVSRIIDDLK